jgi:hypothetical protein
MSRKRKRDSGIHIRLRDDDRAPPPCGCATTSPSPSPSSSSSSADLLRDAKTDMQKICDPDKRNGVTYALFGSSGSGKSTIIRKIFIDDVYSNQKEKELNNCLHGDEYISVLFTESKHADPLKGLTGADDIIIDAMGLDGGVYKWMHMMNYRYEKRYRFVVMIDDVISVKNMSVVYDAFLTYRNMNISSIVSLQYLKLCPLSIRSSLYFCFLLPMNSNEGIEQLVRGYMAMYLPGKTLDAKIAKYKEMATDHHFFLLDNLNHKCYYVDNNFFATEMKPRPAHENAHELMEDGRKHSDKNLDELLPPSHAYD